MLHSRAISKRVLGRLVLPAAIFLGLNLLCFLGVMHGHRAVHHTRVNFSHIPAQTTRRSGRDSVALAVDAIFDHSVVDYAPKAALSLKASPAKGKSAGGASAAAAVATAMLVLARPERQTELLAEENVIALGSAPRAPGLGRAPPIAA